MRYVSGTRLFSQVFGEKAEVRIQLPLSRFSEVDGFVPDVFLVVEISDSSLRYDRDVKLPVYAAADVPEVWIEDLPNQILHVYREPFRRQYKVALRFHVGDSVSPDAFPEVVFSVSDLLRLTSN